MEQIITKLRDELIGALIGLSRAVEGNPPTEDTFGLIIDSLASMSEKSTGLSASTGDESAGLSASRGDESAELSASTDDESTGLSASRGDESAELSSSIAAVRAEKFKLVPDCAVCMNPCGHNDDYDMTQLQNETEEIRTLKLQIRDDLIKLAVLTQNAGSEIQLSDDLNLFFCEALFHIGYDEGADELKAVLERIRQSSFI